MINNPQNPNKIEWYCLVIPFIIFNLFQMISLIVQIDTITINRGICHLINCNLFLLTYVKLLLVIWLVISFALFFQKKFKLYSLFSFLIISLIIYSLEESFGIQSATGIIPLIWLAIIVAYCKYIYFNFKKESMYSDRILYPIQVISAGYTLAAISKLSASGFHWVLSAKNMALQMIKTNQVGILDNIYYGDIISTKVLFVMQHRHIIGFLLLGALMMELTSGLAIINSKTRIFYGITLTCMHIGIYYFFHIHLYSFIISMFLFFINPFYLIYRGISRISITPRTN